MNRASQGSLERGSPNRSVHELQLTHALQLVRELQAKKHAADDKMEIVHLRA